MLWHLFTLPINKSLLTGSCTFLQYRLLHPCSGWGQVGVDGGPPVCHRSIPAVCYLLSCADCWCKCREDYQHDLVSTLYVWLHPPTAGRRKRGNNEGNRRKDRTEEKEGQSGGIGRHVQEKKNRKRKIERQASKTATLRMIGQRERGVAWCGSKRGHWVGWRDERKFAT